ncbi:dipeptide/oligopeptide/nickel ABC transporter permease/ATP-binding protein [Paramicrobacterium fandaimingii]|uniref:dipeptide/oligopeptide/nickel ABC transporter permease/ATP-binding protein n=1 Tax=Paramicrobacterium fandaimingii TaxID=2708079 RepID=UPI00141DD456|nr:dipeptide/oligopeptide/nickel ABC transporter permease/ATP-binding protein [Microbacterium fandaimingii]
MTSRRQGSPRVFTGTGRNLFAATIRKPLGAASLLYLALVVVATAAAPWIAPYDPLEQRLESARLGPSAEFLLGTDALGRDILSRLLYGGQETLIGVAQALIVALALAIPLGIAAGYLGGWVDRLVMRIVDVTMAIPGIIVTLAVLAIFSNSMTAAMVTFGALVSGVVIRVIRSSVLGVREELYMDAARTIGLTDRQILVRHVLPRTLGVIIVQTALLAAIALGVQTGLAFLGFGPPPPAPTWGGMVGEASSMLQLNLWMIFPTAGVITITTLAFGLLGDAVRDANAERFAGAHASSSTRRTSELASAPVGKRDKTALLSVRALTVAFGTGSTETIVLDGVDFDVRPGETVGLVGESGSGKTVTALAVLGLLASGGRIVSGSIWFDGEDISGYSRAQYRRLRGKEIALISQEPMVALDPAFRVGYQVTEAVRSHERCSQRAARARAIELLDAVRLPDPRAVASLYPHQLSGGMAQRVAIAIALAGRPRLLVADEPTTALDVTVQAEILDLLRQLQRDAEMSIMFVTHDWGVVADICDRAVVMYAGQVVERATVRELFADPLHPYTKGLRSASPHHARRGEPMPAIGGMVPPPTEWPRGCHFAPRCPIATAACSEERVDERLFEDGRTGRCIRISPTREHDRHEAVMTR